MAKTLFDEHEPAAARDAKPRLRSDHRTEGAPKALSDLYFAEAILAVKESTDCSSLEELKSRLTTVVLEQNSAETCLRCARFVIRCFFPDGLDGVARKTWVAYHDEKILSDVAMRLLDDLSQILRQHTWDKELDLWIGPESPLRTALDGLRVETIDLLDLFDAGKAPLDDDDVREYVARNGSA